MPIVFAIWIALGLFSSIAGAHYTTKIVKNNPHYAEIKAEKKEIKQSTLKTHVVKLKNLPMYKSPENKK
jgi:hypothetical protein